MQKQVKDKMSTLEQDLRIFSPASSIYLFYLKKEYIKKSVTYYLYNLMLCSQQLNGWSVVNSNYHVGEAIH